MVTIKRLLPAVVVVLLFVPQPAMARINRALKVSSASRFIHSSELMMSASYYSGKADLDLVATFKT
jgi:hypothetical protein